MNAHRNGTPMLASSGYVAQVDADRVSQSRIKRLRGLSQPQCRVFVN